MLRGADGPSYHDLSPLSFFLSLSLPLSSVSSPIPPSSSVVLSRCSPARSHLHGLHEEVETGDEEGPSIRPPPGRESGVIKVMTWNIDAATRGSGDCAFVLPHLVSHDIVCLQEVTPAAVEWLNQEVPKTYIVLTPQRHGGRAWPHEGHDVAMVINSLSLRLRRCKVKLLDSEQQRCVLIATLLCLRSGSTLVVGTTHLESGQCDPYNLRVLQLRSALSFVDGPNIGCSVLAGDLNLRDWESQTAKVVWGRGDGGVGGGQGVGGWEERRVV